MVRLCEGICEEGNLVVWFLINGLGKFDRRGNHPIDRSGQQAEVLLVAPSIRSPLMELHPLSELGRGGEARAPGEGWPWQVPTLDLCQAHLRSFSNHNTSESASIQNMLHIQYTRLLVSRLGTSTRWPFFSCQVRGFSHALLRSLCRILFFCSWCSVALFDIQLL